MAEGLKVLFIGGSGNISEACSELAHARGMRLTLLNRGLREAVLPDGLERIQADIQDLAAVEAALKGRVFDVVVNWIAFRPEQVEQDIRLFSGRCSQYIFISSASAYQKPPQSYLVTEATPLENPFWQYSRDKAACEMRLWQALETEGFPATIVRPSLTYSRTMLPAALGGHDYTLIGRIRAGKEIVVHGDGTSLWVMTHHRDFAKGFTGLLGLKKAVGEAYHITSDEVLNWDQIYQAIGEAAGRAPKMVHVPSDLIARLEPDAGPSLLGDKAWSLVFDNSKIKAAVPGYKATIPFSQGMRELVDWMDLDPRRRSIDAASNARLDRILKAYGSLATN